MRYSPNWRFLIRLGLVLVAGAVAVHFTHRWQVRRQVGTYLHHADVAREAGEADREAAFLRRYLVARPDDTDTRERLGRLVCDTARGGQTLYEGYLILQDVLRRDPDRDDLRRYAVEVAMRPGVALFAEARSDVEHLLRKRPDDGELEELDARCLVAARKFELAEKRYETAARHRPDLVSAYAGRATVLRQLNRPADADAAVADMLAAAAKIDPNPNRFKAHVVVAGYWRAYARPELPAAVAAKAVADAQKLPPAATAADATGAAAAEAQKLAPDDLDVLILAADVARDRSAPAAADRTLPPDQRRQKASAAAAEARRLLDRAAEVHPKSPAPYLALAALDAATRQPADAVATIRRGLAAVPDSAPLSLALLDYQVRAGDAKGARATLDDLKAKGLPTTTADYHTARILVLEDRVIDAAQLLDRLQRDLPDDPALARQANLLLGTCYEQLGDPGRRLAACKRAVPVDSADPLWVPAQLGVAEAEAALGRAADALATYRRLKDQAPGAAAPVARLELLRALQTPAEKRDWRAAEEAVAAAEKVLPDATDVRVLRADLLHHQGRPAEARQKLEALRAASPKEAAVWVALAVQDARDKDLKKAAATLDAGEREAGDAPELRLARARLSAEAKEPDLPARIAGLAAGAEKFGPAGQVRLLRSLAAVAAGAGAADAAARLRDQVAALRPNDLGTQLARFDRAAAAGDERAIEEAVAAVSRLDGADGPSARLTRALRLVWRAQHRNERPGLAEAVALLDGLGGEPSGRGRVALAHAVALDLQGNPDAALAKYQQAHEHGEANPQALRRLTELLVAKGRDAEAREILDRLPAASVAGADAQRLMAELSLRAEDTPETRRRALEHAARAVPESSTDPRDHIWRGQVEWRVGDKAKAEAPFRRAASLRPESPDGWLVLVEYLAEVGRKADAAAALAEARGKVAPAERPLFEALAHVRLGETDRAAEAFRRARAARPDHLRTLQAQAEFLLRSGKLPEAQAAFRQLQDFPGASPEDREYGRGMLAFSLTIDRDYQTSRGALAVLGIAPAGESPVLRRRRAMTLALQRDLANKQEAIGLLEGLGDQLTPADRFLLAQTYAAVGNRAQVRVAMAELLRRSDAVPLYVGYYAGWLLRDGDPRAAEPWVARMAKLQPEGLPTAELQARLHAARKDLPAARAVLLPKAEGPDAPVGVVARVCEDVGLYDDAERLYTRFVEREKAARPAAVLVLAGYYGRRGRLDDALRVCREARGTVPAAAVGEAAVQALYTAPEPAPAAADAVAGWLDEAARAAGGEERGALVQLLAAVRNHQGNYAGSVELYRQALAANPRDALSMNNLAYLLSARDGKHDDALGLLARARQAFGPHPVLDDTEAQIRLAKGDADAARRLLEGVLARAPGGTGFFHLAQAELAAGRDLEARLAWRQATDAGLRRADLHPLERAAYDQLAARMR